MCLASSSHECLSHWIRGLVPESSDADIHLCQTFLDRFFGGWSYRHRRCILVFDACSTVHTFFGPVPSRILFVDLQQGRLEWVTPSAWQIHQRGWATMVVEFFL